MSKFESYDDVARYYDNERASIGSDVMAAMIQFKCGKPLKDLHVLDAGCGTGNYAVDFMKYGVGTMTLLDASPGMLEKARNKLTDHIKSGRVKDVVEAKLPFIPFDDNTFDAVMFNVVLHHLESGQGDRNFKSTTEAIKEAKRVLKPGGIIIISTCFPETFQHSVWYTQIIPSITERYVKHFPYADEYEQIFKSAAVKCFQKLNILGFGTQTSQNNYEGPLDPNWRKGSSYWAEATDEEIKEMTEIIAHLKEKGELEAWAKSHDHTETSGSLTIFALTTE